eukprot:CAMPEP_0168803616 /NCGR_PEP_ID=MMETSP0726-20121227/84_1 /TAXON_ID=265536 /ORGANISM="Amphiprora sp., Strain CCMP467" /LENGTH=846 /DNA_ID=CAMNT_0008855419 /DNA_START=38 /DNA_END=2575 /DNA_ORIENTATION=-
MDSNTTADSVLISTLHDQERREQRGVTKVTQQEARRYGMTEHAKNGRIKYTYAGHVFIYDPRSNRAITSWKTENDQMYKNSSYVKKKKEYTSGTRFEKPIMIHKSQEHEVDHVEESHDSITVQVQAQKDKWKSHTVIVVDMSGSMREDDVNGARCRSDGVWTTLARVFVKQQLEAGTCSLHDVVSVVTMQQTARVVVECEPMDWVLYNKLVSFREWDMLKPGGHGFYIPALEKAKALLEINNHGSCSLSLLFFSDGKPSDCVRDGKEFDFKSYNMVTKEVAMLMGEVASRFGRRLHTAFVGMGEPDQEFITLKKMTQEAKLFGSMASFSCPSLNTDSLSQIVSSSVASSLSTKTELTSIRTGHTRAVRTDVKRERYDSKDKKKPSRDWRVFPNADLTKYVVRVWAWNTTTNDFAVVVDPRCRECFKPVADTSYNIIAIGKKKNKLKGQICPFCSACFFCNTCLSSNIYDTHRDQECHDLAHQRRTGYIVADKCPPSYGVAWKRLAFGEGAERLAFKFRFIDENGKFTGPKMVAKESRFVEDLDDPGTNYLQSQRHSYHKTFMRTQATASWFAKLFNEHLEKKVSPSEVSTLIKIEFLDPVIFELVDVDVGTFNVLVEPMIEGKYVKFTDNFGNLQKEDVEPDNYLPEDCGIDVTEAAKLLGRDAKDLRPPELDPELTDDFPNAGAGAMGLDDLGIIEEGSEDEEDSEHEYGDTEEMSGEDFDSLKVANVSDVGYLYAFSHFSYVLSGGRLMVVDLQGSLVTQAGGEKKFILTDPAIHHRPKRGGHYRRSRARRQYGRTDRGREGMKAFFETHMNATTYVVFSTLKTKRRSAPQRPSVAVDCSRHFV